MRKGISDIAIIVIAVMLVILIVSIYFITTVLSPLGSTKTTETPAGIVYIPEDRFLAEGFCVEGETCINQNAKAYINKDCSVKYVQECVGCQTVGSRPLCNAPFGTPECTDQCSVGEITCKNNAKYKCVQQGACKIWVQSEICPQNSNCASDGTVATCVGSQPLGTQCSSGQQTYTCRDDTTITRNFCNEFGQWDFVLQACPQGTLCRDGKCLAQPTTTPTSPTSSCIQVITYATGPSGQCSAFPTPCDVPSGWAKLKTGVTCSSVQCSPASLGFCQNNIGYMCNADSTKTELVNCNLKGGTCYTQNDIPSRPPWCTGQSQPTQTTVPSTTTPTTKPVCKSCNWWDIICNADVTLSRLNGKCV